MGLRLQNFPDHDLSLRIVLGPVTADEVIQSYEAMDCAYGTRWLTYLDLRGAAPAEITEAVPVQRFSEIKHVIAEKKKELYSGRQVFDAVVCRVEAIDETIGFWSAYVAHGDENPTETAFFPSLLEACAWLDLTDAACACLSSAIEAAQGDTPPVRVPRAGADAHRGA